MYYHNSLSKQQNAFLVICTIASSPSPPEPVPTIPQSLVPRGLLDTIGGMLDEYVAYLWAASRELTNVVSPVYSDVEFILPGRRKPFQAARRIYASRRLLKRVGYFETSEPVL